MKKKLLFLFISLFALLGSVNAFTIDKGSQYSKEDDSDNTTRLPVSFKAESGEVITQVELKCSVWDDAGVSVGSSLTCAFEGGSTSYKYPSQPANLIEGKDYNVDLIVTNPTGTKKSVYVKVEGTVLNGSSQGTTKSFIQSVADVKAYKTTAAASNVATLKDMTFKYSDSKAKMSPTFNPDVDEYTVYGIADTINSVTYSYVCTEVNCSVSDASGGQSINGNKITLSKGENKVYITIKSADGTATKKYTFTIYRGETSFNSAKLKTLEFKDYNLTPAFVKDITTYEVVLPTDTTSLDDIMVYEAVDSNAKIEVEGDKKLKEGDNTVKINVTNVTGEETITYTITVKLEDAKAIKVVAYKDGKVTYLVEGAETDEVIMDEKTFETKFPEEYAKIKNGTYAFDENGKRIEKKIDQKEVSLDDDDSTKKSSKVWILVLSIIVGLGIIGASAYFIFFRKPKEEREKLKKEKEAAKNKKKEETKKEDTEKEEVEETTEKEEVEEKDEEEPEEKEEVEEEDEDLKFKRSKTRTVDIDEALSDLMNTKEYDFKTKTSLRKKDE